MKMYSSGSGELRMRTQTRRSEEFRVKTYSRRSPEVRTKTQNVEQQKCRVQREKRRDSRSVEFREKTQRQQKCRVQNENVHVDQQKHTVLIERVTIGVKSPRAVCTTQSLTKSQTRKPVYVNFYAKLNAQKRARYISDIIHTSPTFLTFLSTSSTTC